MSKSLIGKKLGMTQVFSEEGESVPVTVIEAGPCVVTQVKTEAKDGYSAVQIAYGEVKPNKINKPHKGIFDKLGVKPKKHIREFKSFDLEGIEAGDKLTVEQFEVGDLVNVAGVSKGKGFAGNVKRHNHATGPKTHGSRAYRIPGSIGSTDASRVFKGQKLPGRMGHDQVQMQNLQIVKVMKEDNVILVKGSIPGPKKGIITIESVD
ncbi:MAG: 50S ribosomal protein L3 [Halanaerobiaceae bacterium]